MEETKEKDKRKNRRRILILLLLLLLISGCSYTYLNFFNTEGRDDRGARNPGQQRDPVINEEINNDLTLRPANNINSDLRPIHNNVNNNVVNRPNNNITNNNRPSNNNNNNNPIVERRVTATFVANGAIISKSSENCIIRGSGGSCSVVLPTITREGWDIIGWSTNPSGTISEFAPGAIRFLTANTRLYAITSKQLTATFIANGADNINEATRECTKWNQQTSCNITTPSIERTDWTVHGWITSANHNQTTGVITVETNTAISSDIDYYAVTSREYNVTFNANGADAIGVSNLSCTRWNTETTCSIIAPSITKDGANIIGWSTNPLANTSTWNVGEQRDINSNETWYAITSQTLTATFVINGADSIGITSLSCTISNAQTSCSLTAPTITRDGWSIIGWNTNATGTMSGWNVGNVRTISANETWYAITNQTLTATFVANGADSIGATSQSCTRWNTNTTCNVFVPFITRAGGSVFGWNTSATAETGIVAPNIFLGLSESITYYAITNITHTVTFNPNGADTIGATSLNCTRWNAQSTCSVTAPSITREGWIPLGWNQSSTATTSTWNVDATRGVNSNEAWYAITTDFPTISNFPFTGSIETVTLPAGTWRLETWGAQGGGIHGGRGGFSSGEFTTTAPTEVFIVVGGAGQAPSLAAAGGFNGGGRAGAHSFTNGAGGGGGATHIATRAGVLSALDSFRADVLIVAGGGGGNGANHGMNSSSDAGGYGGGTIGGDGLGFGVHGTGRPGTQTSGGIVVTTDSRITGTNGSFGRGGDCLGATTGGGGGAGWFGGAHGGWEGGGGGSGHIAGLLSNRLMTPGNTSMPNPLGGNMIGNAGNGFARITRL